MLWGCPLSTALITERETAASGREPGAVVCAGGDLPDEDLAVLAAGGDQAAFGVLVTRWERRVYRFVLVRLRCEHDAAEVTQESLLRAWRAMPRFRPTARFSTWLFSIAHREAVNVVRRRQRDRRDMTRDTGRTEEAGRDDVLPDVWKAARDVLDDVSFEAVWLRYVEDLEPKQIARVTGKSAVGVRVCLHRARARLEEALREIGPESGVLDGTG